MTTHLRVIKSGPRTTVQDIGRHGWGHVGVPTAGAVDQVRHRFANWLVGNEPTAATLEVTLGGLIVETDGPARVAVIGVAPHIRINGLDAQANEVWDLQRGDTLEVSMPRSGVYHYLAVAGGIDAEMVMGSRSTDTLSGIGPSVVAAGDLLPVGDVTAPRDPEVWKPEVAGRPGLDVPVLPGPHLDRVGQQAYDALLAAPWQLATATDRTAARLDGTPIAADVADLDSEGLFPGAVQLPPDGRPHVCLANHPATGGYPVIALVPRSHIATVAQTRPGGVVHLVAAERS